MATRLFRLVVLSACFAVLAPEASAGTGTKVGTGDNHACAVTPGGAVLCWGENTAGQLGDGTTVNRRAPVQVIGLATGMQAVAAGDTHSCALSTSGGVVCWGSNAYGQLGDVSTTDRLTPVQVDGLASGVLAIAAGESHMCALITGGAVKCWGQNEAGQLGDGTTSNRSAPTVVSGLASGVTTITAYRDHSCALTTGGAAKCWGWNRFGQLGDGTTTNRPTPTQVSGLTSGVAVIAAGQAHTCAVTEDGATTCWGNNFYGELGDGTKTNRTTPTLVSGLASAVTAIAGGAWHTCAVTAGEGVVCWGNNEFAQLGDNTMTNRVTPAPVSGLSGGAQSLSAGLQHTCAVTAAGVVTCWGFNLYGQLGDGAPLDKLEPTPVSGLSDGVAAVSPGADLTCGLTTSGGALCWGAGYYGGIGDGMTLHRPSPTPVSGLASGVARVVAGAGHACAVTSGGAAVCWGANTYGQLGDGTTTHRSTPTPVIGLTSNVAAVATGGGHSCALTTAGAVKCWGYNYYGQVGDNTQTDRSVPASVVGLADNVVAIAAGGYHTCAVTTAGAMACWGEGTLGQLGDGWANSSKVPMQVSGVTSGAGSISAGGSHTCAVVSGAAKCWGYNYYGQVGDGTTTNQYVPTAVSGLATSVLAISAGGSHSCALTAAGAVLCWGYNEYGAIGDGTRTNRLTPVLATGLANGVAALAAGNSNTCAVTAGGGALCWGSNSIGQLGTGARPYGTTPLAVYGLDGAIAATAAAPNRGPAAGGTLVRITGAYFLEGATVAIGGTAAAASVLSTAEIVAVAGPHAAGAADIVVTNPDATQATIAAGFTYEGAAAAPPAGDFTGDLKSDILWHHATQGDVWLWPMDGAAKVSETYVRTVADTTWEIRGQGDMNGDGKADLLWRNRVSGMIYYWPMDGTTPLAETYVGTVDPAYDIVGAGDFNGDGKADLLWRNAVVGDVWVWLMDGATPLAEVYVDTVDPGYLVKGVGDVDGDQKADLVWHGVAGDVWVWLMNGTARLSQTYVGTVADTMYQIQQVADFDGNGKSDLLWWNATQGDVWIWPMDGTTVLAETYVGTVPDTQYRIQAAGDYNGDGQADILWRHAVQGDVWVWLMNGPVKLSEAYVGTVPDAGYQIIR